MNQAFYQNRTEHSDLHFGYGVSLPGLQNIEGTYSFAREGTPHDRSTNRRGNSGGISRFHINVITSSAWLFAAAAFLLPFRDIGLIGLSSWRPVITPVDLLLFVGSSILFFDIWRLRAKFIKNPLLVALMLFVLSRIVSALFSDHVASELRTLVRQGLFALFILGICALGHLGQRGYLNRIYKGFIAGGMMAISISLAGYIFMISTGGLTENINPFVFVGTNQVFNNWPRLSGTFGHSPQYMGQYLVVLGTVILARSMRRDRKIRLGHRIFLVIASAALLLTFSWAWIGGLLLFSGFVLTKVPSHRWLKAVLAAGILTAVIVVSWTMNIGFPSTFERERATQGIPCKDFDTWHHVNAWLDRDHDNCRAIVEDWPYNRLETTYLFAKKTALEIFTKHPFFGTGYRQYTGHVERIFHRELGPSWGTFYNTANCELLFILGSTGLFGALAYLLFVVLVILRKPNTHQSRPEHRMLWFGTLAIIILGINAELLGERAVWFVLGFLLVEDQRNQVS